MSLTFAGMFGPYAIEFSDGSHAKKVPVKIYSGLSGTTLAEVYGDRTKTVLLSNPVITDSIGNLSFYADPGYYRVKYGTITFPICVGIDPEDIAVLGGGVDFAPVIGKALAFALVLGG